MSTTDPLRLRQGFSASNFTSSASDHGLPRQQPYYVDNTNGAGQAGNATTGLNEAVKNSECQTIMAALQGSRSRDQAAEKLGISPRTLRHKLQKLREQGISVTRAYAR
jgi:DNA-binding NtrC family response regulator